jgi:hypothetical protein
MPFILIDGRLQEVSQEAYDVYTIGQQVNPAAGGNVVQLNNTQTILDPNTTNNTPGQTLPTLSEQINNVAVASGVDPNAPLTANEQEIFNIGQRLNLADPAEVPSEQRGDELVLLNTGEVVGIDGDGFTVSEGGLNILPEEIPVVAIKVFDV